MPPHEGLAYEAVSNAEAIAMCPYLGSLAVERANKLLALAQRAEQMMAAEAAHGAEAAAVIAQEAIAASEMQAQTNHPVFELHFGFGSQANQDAELTIASTRAPSEPFTLSTHAAETAFRVHTAAAIEQQVVADTHRAAEQFAVHNRLEKAAPKQAEVVTPRPEAKLKVEPAAAPAPKERIATATSVVVPAVKIAEKVAAPFSKPASRIEKTVAAPVKSKASIKPVKPKPKLVRSMPRQQPAPIESSRPPKIEKAPSSVISSKSPEVKPPEVRAVLPIKRAAPKEIVHKIKRTKPAAKQPTFTISKARKESTPAVKQENHDDYDDTPPSPPDIKQDIHNELDEVFHEIPPTSAKERDEPQTEGLVEVTELFSETHKAIDTLEPAKLPRVEVLIEEVVATLMQPTNINELVSELISPETSEAKLGRVFEEIFNTVDMKVSQAQIKQLVHVLVERKAEFNILHEQAKHTGDRGTHEVLSHLGLSLNDLKRLLVPLHNLIGRIVLTAAS